MQSLTVTFFTTYSNVRVYIAVLNAAGLKHIVITVHNIKPSHV